MGSTVTSLHVALPLQIVEDMKAAGVKFNALTHSLLVESCVVQNDHQGAADAHYEAMAAGNHIRPESFEKLISRCERNGAYDLMVSLCLTLSTLAARASRDDSPLMA